MCQHVFAEVCRSTIGYWDGALAKVSKELLNGLDVRVIGGFSVPAWQVQVPMKYCGVRRMFVASLKHLADGTYPCKFLVKSEARVCSLLYATVLGQNGEENSAVSIVNHPRQDWWAKKLTRFEER